METKDFQSYTKEIDNRTVTGISAVFGNVDSVGDRIHLGAFRKTLKEQGGRVKHLWQHDAWTPPTAVVKSLREVKRDELPDELQKKYPEATGGLEVAREYLNTTRGDEILAGIQSGAITEMSFGYDPVKYDFEDLEHEGKTFQVRNLRELRLWDTSDVNWGANRATIAVKSAVPYKDTGTAEEGSDWSAPNLGEFTDGQWDDLSDSEKRRIAAHFAWVDSMPPETFGDCKLPHHRPAKDGVGPAVWRGVAAAMGALLGARGGVEVPAADKDGIYNHLAKHYAQWEKEPPEKALMPLGEAMTKLDMTKLHYLDPADLGRVMSALSELDDILFPAEPPEDAKHLEALTENLRMRLAIYTRELNLFSGA